MANASRVLRLIVLVAAGCNFDTSYHLLSAGDPVKVELETVPPVWPQRTYDDQAWPIAVQALGPLAAVDGNPPAAKARSRFDLGPAWPAYKQLTLTVDFDGRYVAYVNGAALLDTTSRGPSVLTVPDGVLQARDNVLAIEYWPPAGTTFTVTPQLDGAPDLTSAGPMVVKGPYLLAPSASGITIAWETSEDAPSRAIVDGVAHDGGGGRLHRVRVDGLLPSHAYFYHVEVGATRSEDAQLTTAPAAGEPVRFIVYGDNRTDGDTHRRLVRAIAGEAPDFALNTGDLVGSSDESEWASFFTLEYPFLLQTALYPAMGNHEATYGDEKGRLTELFPLGAPDRFEGRVYGVDYGDVHVAVLDSNGDLGDQAGWLDSDLAAAEARGATHLFIMMHWGPYSSGTSIGHGSNDDAQDHVVPIARKHRVDAIFAGHDHFYEHGVDDGLNYFVTGGGGAPLHEAGTIWQTRVSKSVHHYLAVRVVGDTAHVEARGLDGTTFDQVDLKR